MGETCSRLLIAGPGHSAAIDYAGCGDAHGITNSLRTCVQSDDSRSPEPQADSADCVYDGVDVRRSRNGATRVILRLCVFLTGARILGTLLSKAEEKQNNVV